MSGRRDTPGPDRKKGLPSLWELSRLAAELAPVLEPLVAAGGRILWDALSGGGKVLCCGNGGSAADAQHFAAELVGRMARERDAQPALSLSSDPSVVTALANDYGYGEVFARQVEAWGRPGDALVCLTTSGTSENVLRAFEVGRTRGMKVVALCCANAATPLSAADVFISIPSPSAPLVQELHMAVLHGLCAEVETRLAPGTGGNE